jgi:hypothetical protein
MHQAMNRNLLAALLLSSMLVLAGCNGTGGQSTSPTNTTAAPGANGTPTGTATATPPTTEPVYDTPLDSTAVLDGHNQALSSGGTFRYVQNATVRRVDPPGLIQLTNVTAGVNLTSNALFVRQNVSLVGSSQVYRNESAFAYERRVTAGEVRYQDPNSRAINTTFYKLPPIARYIRGLDYTYVGTETSDGTTLYRYTVTGTDQLTPSEHGLGVIPPEKVAEIESELVVAEGGAVRSFTYDVVGNNTEGDTLRYALSLQYENVGSTAVQAPPWLDEARAAE